MEQTGRRGKGAASKHYNMPSLIEVGPPPPPSAGELWRHTVPRKLRFPPLKLLMEPQIPTNVWMSIRYRCTYRT